MMKKYNVTFYDAAYHAVAILKKGIFLIADESYCRKVKDMKNVVKLEDWE